MEYSIQQVAKAAGTTSRTLRHYDDIGLVSPSRVGRNGYRYYDDRSLVRLQRLLLLRQLGLGLDAIGEVLEAQDARTSARAPRTDGSGLALQPDPAVAEARILAEHLELLRRERQRVEAQIAAVERTIAALGRESDRGVRGVGGVDTGDDPKKHTSTEGAGLMASNIFEGFDYTQHRQEVEQRWGADAYTKSDRWWHGMSEREQAQWKERVHRLGLDWIAVAERGEDPASPVAQDLARRHIEWLQGVEGTPAAEGGDLAAYVLGLADMYVADERFAANYGGAPGAGFVRDALRHYVEVELR